MNIENGKNWGKVMPWKGYKEARRPYVPSSVKVLFVAEAPPDCLQRYFYFPDVRKHDHLWIGLMRALYGDEFGDDKQSLQLQRRRKCYWLTKFKKDGYMLIDALKTPMPEVSDNKKICLILKQSDTLVSEINRINPEQIVLIKVAVYLGLYKSLECAGHPVIDACLPFPLLDSLSEVKFQEKFKKLVTSGKLVL